VQWNLKLSKCYTILFSFTKEDFFGTVFKISINPISKVVWHFNMQIINYLNRYICVFTTNAWGINFIKCTNAEAHQLCGNFREKMHDIIFVSIK